MRDWLDVYAEVERAYEEFGFSMLYFRGHADPNWPLLPGIARHLSQLKAHQPSYSDGQIEMNLYSHFRVNSRDLLPVGADEWTTVFAMQHHGMPTRLLDWSTTFAVALYFALKDSVDDCAVWILNPFELNAKIIQKAELPDTSEMPAQYANYLYLGERSSGGDVIAIYPPRHFPRMMNQRAGFTLHGDLSEPLEVLHPNVVRKIIIPSAARDAAGGFLRLAGVSEFTLFPDLDGLARDLKHRLVW